MFAPDECSDVCLVPSVRPYHIGMESLDLFFLEYPSSRLTIAFLSSEISMCPLSRTSGLLGLFFDRGADSCLKEQANAFPARDPQPTEPFV